MRRLFVTSFRDDHALLHAVDEARRQGWQVVDAYTPCPIHGLEESLGRRPSRLPWACLLFGAFGAAFMMWFQYWTSAVDWRLNVGGRPWNSSLSFACVAFEVMVLAAGIGSVVTFLTVARLRPGAPPGLAIEGVTDDRFAMVIEETVENLSLEKVIAALAPLGLDRVEERILEDDDAA